jgi:tetratricopeptide (TPR) repeat protein
MKTTHKAALAILALLFAATFLVSAARSYVVQSSATSASAAELRRAIRIAPDNSALHYALGREMWLQNHDLPVAISEYKTATNLNPYPADYWIELATAYSVAGDDAGRDAAISRAERAAPYDTTVLWDVANLNLMRGDTADALHQMRTATQYSTDSWDRYVERCWKITNSIDTVMAEALPASATGYEALLHLTSFLNRPDDAEKVWRRAQSLKLRVSPQVALQYFDFLLDHARGADGALQWRQYTSATSDLQGYAPKANNLIVNPNFELPVLNAGLDWRYSSQHGVSVTIDHAAHGDAGSAVAISFDGTPTDAGIYQLVPVSPSTTYRLSASARSEIAGIDGPRLAIYDATTQKPLLLSEPVTGSTDWHHIGGSFRTSDSTSLVLLRIVRVPSTSQIRGSVWLRGLELSLATTAMAR